MERNGFAPSQLPGVQLIASDCSQARQPLVYEPSIVIIAQGEKTGYLDDRIIHYGRGHYLVQALPLPFECETRVDADAPLLGLSIHIDIAELAELAKSMPDLVDADETPLPMAAVPIDQPIGLSVLQLVECLHDPTKRAVLGRDHRRAVLFEALRGPQGASLLSLLNDQSYYARVANALNRLHREYSQPLTMETLARDAHMSQSAFHQRFKQLTCVSPLQYQKRIRLLKARSLLMQPAINVNRAATDVGYRSSAQFSREYKRYFGVAPAHDCLSSDKAPVAG